MTHIHSSVQSGRTVAPRIPAAVQHTPPWRSRPTDSAPSRRWVHPKTAAGGHSKMDDDAGPRRLSWCRGGRKRVRRSRNGRWTAFTTPTHHILDLPPSLGNTDAAWSALAEPTATYHYPRPSQGLNSTQRPCIPVSLKIITAYAGAGPDHHRDVYLPHLLGKHSVLRCIRSDVVGCSSAIIDEQMHRVSVLGSPQFGKDSTLPVSLRTTTTRSLCRRRCRGL